MIKMRVCPLPSNNMPAVINFMHKIRTFFFCFFSFANLLYAQSDRLVLVSASYGKNILAITEANGDVIWNHKTSGPEKGHAGHHDVHMLPNGNILFHETWQDVKEITLGKKIVMDYDCATANGLSLIHISEPTRPY